VPTDLGGLDADYDFVFVATGRGSGDAGGFDATGRSRVLAGGDIIRSGLVSAALAGGRLAAEAIDAAIAGRPPRGEAPLPPIGVERLTLGWYQDAPRHECDPDITAEARRCMSCGLCMDCERCWMHCANNCFEKLPKGQHYGVKVDTCNGCRKCADECPCGYIDLM
jgi:Pyruvate/2-oxoacid:ferredoxin oxidoreductase delta subunit